jgi:hypothetical protein
VGLPWLAGSVSARCTESEAAVDVEGGRRSVARKSERPRVAPGVELVRTSLRRFTSLLIKLDLPTFERPPNATSASIGGGRPS